MRIFGIDPGSERTGYGCVETDGSRHVLVACGTISARPIDAFPERLARIHRELSTLLAACRPDCVAIETLFHATNVRSALKLGHARGVAVLAAVEAGCPVVEYSPAEVKRAVVGYGRAEKHQVQQMIKMLLGLQRAPSPHDAADAVAVAICHLNSMPPVGRLSASAREARYGETSPKLREGGKAAPTVETGERPPRPVAGAGFGRSKSAARSWRQYRPPTV